MSLLEWANLGGTLLTFGCFSFAVTSFGGKLGRLNGFKNTSGYKYITDATHSNELFEDIVKVYKDDSNAPDWVKDRDKLRDRCKSYQYSLKYWTDTAKYCLVQNNVRHKLIEDGVKLKQTLPDEQCTDEILNRYSDGKDSLSYLLGKKKCEDTSTPAPATAPAATPTPTTTVTPTPTTIETTAPGGGSNTAWGNSGGSNGGNAEDSVSSG